MILEEGLRVLKIEADAILRLAANLDQKFVDAVMLCYECRGRIVVVGIGKSGNIGKKIAATLASTGTPAFFLHPAEAIHGDLGNVLPDDVVLILSYSGETVEILNLMPSLKRQDLKIITITGNLKSSLAQMSHVVLDISVSEEACPLGLAPTTSTTNSLALGDALAIALLSKRGFKKEDFAAFHPGGMLGRKLLVKVSEVMHQGEAIPKVFEETPIHEVIIEMTTKKLGMTLVLSRDQRLSGVITDGDLRRLMLSYEDHKKGSLLVLQAKAVMNTKPKTIRKEALIAEAIHLMETTSITTLVATNAEGFVDGVVHLHDILKTKGI
ncbi:MAG: KpsF/GutQ family sugar-phosphate isomerase [Nitrospirota bacterium]